MLLCCLFPPECVGWSDQGEPPAASGGKTRSGKVDEAWRQTRPLLPAPLGSSGTLPLPRSRRRRLRIYHPPSTDQKPGQEICHFDVSIFAPVKSELESRPSRSQMPSASANDTSRRRTFSAVTNAIEPDQASGAPGR